MRLTDGSLGRRLLSLGRTEVCFGFVVVSERGGSIRTIAREIPNLRHFQSLVYCVMEHGVMWHITHGAFPLEVSARNSNEAFIVHHAGT